MESLRKQRVEGLKGSLARYLKSLVELVEREEATEEQAQACLGLLSTAYKATAAIETALRYAGGEPLDEWSPMAKDSLRNAREAAWELEGDPKATRRERWASIRGHIQANQREVSIAALADPTASRYVLLSIKSAHCTPACIEKAEEIPSAIEQALARGAHAVTVYDLDAETWKEPMPWRRAVVLEALQSPQGAVMKPGEPGSLVFSHTERSRAIIKKAMMSVSHVTNDGKEGRPFLVLLNFAGGKWSYTHHETEQEARAHINQAHRREHAPRPHWGLFYNLGAVCWDSPIAVPKPTC